MQKIPQDWATYLSTDILSALPLIKKHLEKFTKNLNFVIDDLIEIFSIKKNYKDKEIKFLKKNFFKDFKKQLIKSFLFDKLFSKVKLVFVLKNH